MSASYCSAIARDITRRRVLRGLAGGAAVSLALPFLDGMLNESGTALAASGAPLPVRFGTWFWGLGLTPGRWEPDKRGADYDLKTELLPIAPYKQKVSVLTGFDVMLDGGANFPHITGNYGLRTGIVPPTNSKNEGNSFDVMISDQIGTSNRFRSLEVTASADAKHSYSFRGPGLTNPAEASPVAFYARIFGPEFQDPNADVFTPDVRMQVRRSVLSLVSEDRARLESRLGAQDRQRLDQYFTALRQIENQLELQLQKPPPAEACKLPGKATEATLDTDVDHVRANHKLMTQLLTLAVACNQTRVFNMVFSPTQSNLRRTGNNTDHHQVTHEEAIDKQLGYQPVAAWYCERSMEEWALFLGALDGVREGAGTLLDQSVILAHTDSYSARAHTIQGIPMMVAGRGGGKLKPGQHIAANGEPVTRVGLTMMQVMGVPVDRWGSKSMLTSKPVSELLA